MTILEAIGVALIGIIWLIIYALAAKEYLYHGTESETGGRKRMVAIEMDMPNNCGECRLHADGWCYAVESSDKQGGELSYRRRPKWCPLQEVQDGQE